MDKRSKSWNRIDKATGQIFATTEDRVMAQAASYFSDCDIYDELGGRFTTPFAIYALSANISEEEWNQGSLAPVGCKL